MARLIGGKLLNAAVLFLLLTVPASAKTITFDKQVEPGELRGQLERAGFHVQDLHCAGTMCTLTLANNEAKDPQPIIDAYQYVDRAAQRDADFASLRALAKKIDAGTITDDELKQAVRTLIRRVVGD